MLGGRRPPPPLFTKVAAEIFGVAGMGVGCVAGDAVIAHELGQRLLYGLHAFGPAGFNVGSELMVVSAANQISDSAGGHEDFNGGVAVDSVDCGQQALMNDGQQGERELTPHLGLEA